jgi:hypothetical protein
MLDKKRRLYRLIESYINDYQGKSVQEMYGKGSRIKIHNLNFSVTQQSILMEAVIVLGDLITEEHMDRALADVLIQDAMVYFFPECSVKTYVRFDV